MSQKKKIWECKYHKLSKVISIFRTKETYDKLKKNNILLSIDPLPPPKTIIEQVTGSITHGFSQAGKGISSGASAAGSGIASISTSVVGGIKSAGNYLGDKITSKKKEENKDNELHEKKKEDDDVDVDKAMKEEKRQDDIYVEEKRKEINVEVKHEERGDMKVENLEIVDKTEEIHEFELKDFPVIVAVDSRGNSIHRAFLISSS